MNTQIEKGKFYIMEGTTICPEESYYVVYVVSTHGSEACLIGWKGKDWFWDNPRWMNPTNLLPLKEITVDQAQAVVSLQGTSSSIKPADVHLVQFDLPKRITVQSKRS